MSNLFSRKTLEKIVVSSVALRPHQMYFDNKIYYTPSKAEDIVFSHMESVVQARTLSELEDAVQQHDVSAIYIGRYAAITSKGLKKVLERNGLSKTIYCAFPVNLSEEE